MKTEKSNEARKRKWMNIQRNHTTLLELLDSIFEDPNINLDYVLEVFHVFILKEDEDEILYVCHFPDGMAFQMERFYFEEDPEEACMCYIGELPPFKSIEIEDAINRVKNTIQKAKR